MRVSTDERLFNVDMNGARVATGVTREDAEKYLDARRAAGTGSCYVYLMDKPLESRRKPRWAPPIPRLPSLRVSAATRQKLTDALLADGTLRVDDYAPHIGPENERVTA